MHARLIRLAHRVLLSAGIGLGLLLAACAAAPRASDHTLAVALDRQATLDSRLQAIDAAGPPIDSPQAWRRALLELTFGARQLQPIREAAFERWMLEDSDSLWREVAVRLPYLRDRNLHRWLCQQIAAHRQPQLAPALVRSWSRVRAGEVAAAGPEHAALATLFPDRPPIATVEHMLHTSADEPTVAADAWQLLARLHPPSEHRELVARLPRDHPLGIEFRAFDALLGVLPLTREQVVWLTLLHAPRHRTMWEQATQQAALLRDLPRGMPFHERGLHLRHLPWLARMDASGHALPSRSSLIAQLAQWPTTTGWHRSPPRHGASAPLSLGDLVVLETRGQTPSLAWADLVTLARLRAALATPTLIQSLWEQIDRDHADGRTEHGGLLLEAPDGALVATPFPPTLVRHDRMYIPPLDLIEALPAALAHYHFHAHALHGQAYAGPGAGDLDLAARMGFTGIVATLVGRDAMNLDVYFPHGASVDLGTWHR